MLHVRYIKVTVESNIYDSERIISGHNYFPPKNIVVSDVDFYNILLEDLKWDKANCLNIIAALLALP